MTERILRALHMPADERAKSSIYTDTLTNLRQRANIEWIDIVKTEHMQNYNCVMVVDDDGLDRQLPVNRRAQFLSRYPLEHPIVGDVLFFSLEENLAEGASLVDISQVTLDGYLLNPAIMEGYCRWLNSSQGIDYAHRYGLRELSFKAWKDEKAKEKCPGHAPAGGAYSEEPSEPHFCDGSCQEAK